MGSGTAWLSIFVIIITGLQGILATKCGYCGKDFVCLARHTWRCTSRITSSAYVGPVAPVHAAIDKDRSDNISSANGVATLLPTDTINCVCGRACKGRRGLKAHQRSCKNFNTLGASATNELSNGGSGEVEECVGGRVIDEEEGRSHVLAGGDENNASVKQSPTVFNVLPGLKLPKPVSGWEEANLYFRINIELLPSQTKLSEYASALHELIYKYFADNQGTVCDTNEMADVLSAKYNSLSVRQLKKALR